MWSNVKKEKPKSKKSTSKIGVITLLISICFVTAIWLVGCSVNEKQMNSDDDISKSVTTSEQAINESTTEISTNEIISKQVINETTEISTEEVTVDELKNSFDINEIAPYDDQPYIENNNNIPFFSEEEKQSTVAFETYSDFDELGRCGVAYANVCQELMPTEERGEIGPIKPSGWHTVKYNDLIDGNYLYNRCHLIGYQLTGENANELNLITGTRYLNVQGMLPFEDKVADYVKNTDNHVLYRVTPVFDGNNLVASGVIMEAFSVEDQGSGICFNVYCYNVQPGIIIDYSTGDSYCDPDVVVSTEQTTENTQATETMETTETSSVSNCDYVVNTNTKKIHLPSCSSVDDMAEHNKWYYEGDIDDLIEEGYQPCKRCLGN